MINEIKSLDDQAGTDVSRETDFRSVLKTGGLDFRVEKVPVHTPEGDVVSGRYLIRREDNKFVLGNCGKRYTLVDNETMFRPFHDVVTDFGASYENAGIISSGKINWISAKMPDNFSVETKGGRDEYVQRVIMMVYHDGMKRNVYFSFNNRIICNNMLSSMERGGRNAAGVRHTSNWEENLALAHKAFVGSIDSSRNFMSSAQRLADLPMTNGEAKKFATRFVAGFKEDVKDVKNGKKQSDRSKTIMENRAEHVLSLFEEGVGNSGKTRYDMMNAVTEYLDHHVNRAKTSKAISNRFISNLSGNQARAKHLVVAELLK